MAFSLLAKDSSWGREKEFRIPDKPELPRLASLLLWQQIAVATVHVRRFLVVDLHLTRSERNPSFLWDALAFCLWPLVWLMGRDGGHIVLPFVIVLLYLAAFRGRICSAIFSHPVITDIGGMCYSIYLFHVLVIYGVKHLSSGLHFGQSFWLYFTLQCCLIIPVVLLVCGTFFLLIERPCMDREWPMKLWRQGQALRRSLAQSTVRM